jgi:hypothetical protein
MRYRKQPHRDFYQDGPVDGLIMLTMRRQPDIKTTGGAIFHDSRQQTAPAHRDIRFFQFFCFSHDVLLIVSLRQLRTSDNLHEPGLMGKYWNEGEYGFQFNCRES